MHDCSKHDPSPVVNIQHCKVIIALQSLAAPTKKNSDEHINI